MPPRPRASPSAAPAASFCPPNDTSTYRDLLLFEERLKTNAASLQKRKVRYQLFLGQLLLVIVFLLYEVLAPPASSLLAVPYTAVLRTLRLADDGDLVAPNAYGTVGMLFVCVTTLVLFFASGLYSEKIGYANKYVPHANRALRSFNMYLNVRQPPLASKFPLNPLAFFFPRPAPASPSPTRTPATPSTPTRRTGSVPISPIPPSGNPRGELIFSSRVDRTFRDAYERYRGAFERKRAEKERERGGWGSWVKSALGFETAGGGGGGGGGATPTTPRGRGTPRSGTPPAVAGERRGSRRTGTPGESRQAGVRYRAKPAGPQQQPGSPSVGGQGDG